MTQTLNAFLDANASDAGVADLIRALAGACVEISHAVRRGATAGLLGVHGEINVQGEVQKTLDVLSDDIVLKAVQAVTAVVAAASEEQEGIAPFRPVGEAGKLLVAFDPLDGSSNVDVNVSIGTIFSILPAPEGETREAKAEDFFQPGTNQLAAGYAVYGPQTLLVVTLGQGVFGFTLDPDAGDWLLTHKDISIPRETKEFAINVSNRRHWAPEIQAWHEDCVAGKTGPRGRDFNMRWIASMVADVNRILMRGGVFLYPWDAREPNKPGKLRLVYEAAPMSMLVEQAGGRSIQGERRILECVPTGLHERISVMLGSADEITAIEGYKR
jgi:fructose-1,6-bisphosphatase I